MDELKQKTKNISRLTGEFTDPSLEHHFYSHMLQETIQDIRRNLFVFSFLFLIFIIPEYFVIKDEPSMGIIFFIRLFFFLISILYFFRIHHNPNSLYFSSTIYGIVGSVLLWALLYFYKNPNIYIHQQGLLAFILAIFLILPNRFYHKLLMSLLTSSGFFYIAFRMGLSVELRYYLGLMTFTIIIILFCFLTTTRINRLQRIQFQNSLELAKISNTDALTGAYNRLKYNEELKREMSRACRYKLPLSGIMFDLDNFKEINDEFGHLEGDKVLQKVTQLIQNMIRENDQLFRWGGEEFIILLPNTKQDSAIQIAQRIKNSFKTMQLFPIKKLTGSFGATSLKNEDTTITFTNRLDQLQYQAKNKGKDCIIADSGCWT